MRLTIPVILVLVQTCSPTARVGHTARKSRNATKSEKYCQRIWTQAVKAASKRNTCVHVRDPDSIENSREFC